MKKLLVTSVFAVFLLGGFTNVDRSITSFSNTNEAVIILDNLNDEHHIVKAIIVDGEVIPSLELPEVTITGKRSMNHMVNAEIIDGVIYPVVELEEVVIQANS